MENFMKNYMLFLLMSFVVHDAMGSFGSVRRLSSVNRNVTSELAAFQNKHSKIVGVGIGFFLSLFGGFLATELHQVTLGNERAEVILKQQQDLLNQQEEMQKTLQDVLSLQKEIRETFATEKKVDQKALERRVLELEKKNEFLRKIF
jgi:hypothetical protein